MHSFSALRSYLIYEFDVLNNHQTHTFYVKESKYAQKNAYAFYVEKYFWAKKIVNRINIKVNYFLIHFHIKW